ncbi:MAG: hypothetical protein HYZ83_03130 [Candidatus Omnitrophica bacterium]|nr:hypothetical protein [Candidatus Omnitrophota bacterium]
MKDAAEATEKGVRELGVDVLLERIALEAKPVLNAYASSSELERLMLSSGLSLDEIEQKLKQIFERQIERFLQSEQTPERLAAVIYWTPELAQNDYLIRYLQALQQKFEKDSSRWKIYLIVPKEQQQEFAPYATTLAKYHFGSNVRFLIEGSPLSRSEIRNHLNRKIFKDPDFGPHSSFFFAPETWNNLFTGQRNRTVETKTILGGALLLLPLSNYFATRSEIRADLLREAAGIYGPALSFSRFGSVVIGKNILQILFDQNRFVSTFA